MVDRTIFDDDGERKAEISYPKKTPRDPSGASLLSDLELPKKIVHTYLRLALA